MNARRIDRRSYQRKGFRLPVDRAFGVGQLRRRYMPPIPIPDNLHRDGVALRRLRARDAGPFAQAFREDPALGALIGADEDPTESGVRRFIARQPRMRARGEFLGLAVTDGTGRPFLGHVMLHTLDFKHARAEIGYWLVPAARGRGTGKAAVSLLVDWAFARLALHRLEITTTPDNTAARALAASLGFAEECIMHERNLERGRRVDVVLLARLRK
jgi:[ribosomal protein S5]-alanine N-acetyltransferase